jgi:hypothetical protein
MSTNKGGRPSKTEWDKVRIVAWTNLVRVRVQKKLDEASSGPLPKEDAFLNALKYFQSRWTIKYGQPVALTNLGEMFLGRMTEKGKKGEKVERGTRTDFAAYRIGRNACPNDSVICAVDNALPGTGDFYRYGPYKVPLWVALSGNLTLVDFWGPLMQSKVFDAPQWSFRKILMEGEGLESDITMALLKTPWQVWLDTITRMLSTENEATEETEKAVGHRKYGYATIGIAAIHLAIQDDPDSDSQKKLELCRLVEGFDSLWKPLDDNFLVGENESHGWKVTTNPYPIVGAVKNLTDKLRAIAEKSIQCDD